MPLLISPIDGSPMKQINRYGIEIDMCPTSGGVWLDKGELEKIIGMIQKAAEENASSAANENYEHDLRHAANSEPYREKQLEYKRDSHRNHGKKRESALEQIIDLFDF